MPGLRGTPAVMITRSAPNSASPSFSGPVWAVTRARQRLDYVEFSAEDASRSDPDYLAEVFAAVIEAGEKAGEGPAKVSVQRYAYDGNSIRVARLSGPGRNATAVPKVDALIYLLSGRMNLHLGDEVFEVKAGDALREPAGIPVFWDRPADFPVADDIATAMELGFESIVVHADGVTPEVVQAIHAAGLESGAWTANDAAEMKRLRGLGVKRIYTDSPGMLLGLKN